jgi:hypothetical protein
MLTDEIRIWDQRLYDVAYVSSVPSMSQTLNDNLHACAYIIEPQSTKISDALLRAS